MNYTKKELIENVARNVKKAEIFYEAATAAVTGTELSKLNLIQAANKISCALMYLNTLHKNEYEEEFFNAYEIEKNLKEMPAKDIDYYNRKEVREALTVLNCIVKYNANYFKDEEGYL